MPRFRQAGTSGKFFSEVPPETVEAPPRDGVRYQWMSQPGADVFVLKRAREVTVPLRHEIGAFREPASVAITLDGRPLDRLRLDDGNWRPSTIRLRTAGGG